MIRRNVLHYQARAVYYIIRQKLLHYQAASLVHYQATLLQYQAFLLHYQAVITLLFELTVLFSVQNLHSSTLRSVSLQIPGHHTVVCARSLHLLIPVCPLWILLRISGRSVIGRDGAITIKCNRVRVRILGRYMNIITITQKTNVHEYDYFRM